jgi:subtilase family serine protease
MWEAERDPWFPRCRRHAEVVCSESVRARRRKLTPQPWPWEGPRVLIEDADEERADARAAAFRRRGYAVAVCSGPTAASTCPLAHEDGCASATGADLVVSSLTSPPTGGAGATIVVSDTTANQGAGDAAASATAFYLSANLVLDGTDVRLGARSAPALAAGAASTASTSLAIPPDVAPGTYYVIASADANQQVAESLETNNTKTGLPIRIGPDLAQASTTAPSTGGAGGTIAVGDTAKNQGGGAAGASTTGIYISTTSVFSSSSATLLGTRAVPALAAGTVSTGSTTVTLPATLATGNYYVIAVADTNSAVAETNETNNAALGVLVRVGPDLTVSAASAPTSIAVGTSAVVNSTILNQGGGAAASSTTRFYLSANLALDASDILVGTRAVGALAAGQSDAGPATITVPSGTATGSYFLLIVADGDGAVAETFETNNVRTAALTIKSGS